MESYQLKQVTFQYPTGATPALIDLDLTVFQGEFLTLCGRSGSGKTTLLRLLKPGLAPFGNMTGEFLFYNEPLADLDFRRQSGEIGFVLQSPDNQIVTDKVWHELAFGLESLGMSNQEVRGRVSEMASFFGIEDWFHKKTAELSGGQKQLLNLASVMVMQPSVLVLDEPTSQLDPIGATTFLETLKRINREFGTTVILSEHRLEEAFALSDRVVVLEAGKIFAMGTPEQVEKQLRETDHDMKRALPTPMRIYQSVKSDLPCPVTVRDGREWLSAYAKRNPLDPNRIPKRERQQDGEELASFHEVWFRYHKELPDVLKGLSFHIKKGELLALLGGNGVGKTTVLSLLTGLVKPYRGKITLHNEDLKISALPQNPQTLFVKKTVGLDLKDMLRELQPIEQEEKINQIASLCGLTPFLDRHPYDLSGGEQQRAGLAKVLLTSPDLLLLDEPTKGMDANFKELFSKILVQLKEQGISILMVSHDMEFCAEHADRCALVFDGNISSMGTPEEFFQGKRFYTTAASRMARNFLPQAILAEDVIAACGGEISLKIKKEPPSFIPKPTVENNKTLPKEKKPRFLLGAFMLLLTFITAYLTNGKWEDWRSYAAFAFLAAELGSAFFFFFPGKPLGTENYLNKTPLEGRKLKKQTLLAGGMILLVAPLTVYVGYYFFGDRKYYFISLLLILQTMMPFFLIFEHRRPQARELALLAALCAIGVAGRGAFYMLPQFKLLGALVILSGVCFGGEIGFFVGAVTVFASNMIFGQGPWTPWQMFTFGLIGFLSGILYQKGLLQKTKGSLCLFGGFSVLLLYGGIMNPATVLINQANPTWEFILLSYGTGLPMDLIHAFSTVFFLWFLSEPLIDKFTRIQVKYGIFI